MFSDLFFYQEKNGNQTTINKNNTKINIITSRLKPNFKLYNNHNDINKTSLSRKPRAAGAMFATVGKMFGWTAAMTIAGVATSAIDTAINKPREEKKKPEKSFGRKKFNCQQNNFGCLKDKCWTNCGPRIYSADWCNTKKNVTSKELVTCEEDTDCSPCWPCASSCTMELADEEDETI